jgi:hypothetical protein
MFSSRTTLDNQESSKFNARGATGDFFVKNTPKNNFSTNELISRNKIPIDSARQVEEGENFRKFQN